MLQIKNTRAAIHDRAAACIGAVTRPRRTRVLGLLLALVTVTATEAGTAAQRATLILVHGRIDTLDSAQPWAQAIAVGGHSILAVGSDADILSLKTANTRVIDLHGRLVTPGLIDTHVHFTEGGQYLRHVPLRDASTMAEVTKRVAQYAHEHPQAQWIQGEGWSYGYPDLPQGEFRKEILDRISPHRPVLLTSGMAHAAWANSEALRRAGITRDTPNPAGGEIVRDAQGEATGWLKEEAAGRLVQDKIPAPTPTETKQALLAAIHEANRVGLTRVDSAGGDFPNLGTLAQIEREGGLTLRISIADWVNPPGMTPDHLAILNSARATYHGDYLTCCIGKFIMDGVIESHTAYLPGGYADDPHQTGMRFFEPDAYKASVRMLNTHGYQVYTHAIGDGAIKLALDAYEDAQKAATPGSFGASPRNRIEHGEQPDPTDIPRFGQLGVIASMQPLMIYPRDEWKGMEGLWEKLAGARYLPQAFAIRSLLDTHAVVSFGTDWPIVQLNPLLGIRNAVLRQSLDGQPVGGYVPAQRVTVAEALRAYTLDAAFASHADSREGSLVAGKFADLVVFSKNFVEEPSTEIADARVTLTLVGGTVVYEGN